MEWQATGMEGERSEIEGNERDKTSAVLGGFAEGGSGFEVVREMVEMIEKVGSYTNFRKTQRKECLNLVRRLKLLTPLFEEIKELHSSISDEALNQLVDLKKALLASKKLLKTCNSGSKIFLALESEAVMSRFHEVYVVYSGLKRGKGVVLPRQGGLELSKKAEDGGFLAIVASDEVEKRN